MFISLIGHFSIVYKANELETTQMPNSRISF